MLFILMTEVLASLSSPHPSPSSVFENVTFELRYEYWERTSHGNCREKKFLLEEEQKSRFEGTESFERQQGSQGGKSWCPRNKGYAMKEEDRDQDTTDLVGQWWEAFLSFYECCGLKIKNCEKS